MEQIKQMLLTGDIHHLKVDGKNERYSVNRYLQISKKYNINPIIFVTGKEIDENTDFWNKIIKRYKNSFTLGGHTYSAFDYYPLGFGFLMNDFCKSLYGTRQMQRKDIDKCVNAFLKLNVNIKDWRTHCYSSNKTTREILRKKGIKRIYDIFDSSYAQQNSNAIPKEIARTFPIEDNVVRSKFKLTKEVYFDMLKQHIMDKKRKYVCLNLHPYHQKRLGWDYFEDVCKAIKETQK